AVKVRFASRQRGSLQRYKYDAFTPPTSPPADPTHLINSDYNIWAQVSDDPAETAETGSADLYFRHELKYYENPPTGATPPNMTLPNVLAHDRASHYRGLHTLGFMNGSYGYPLTRNELGTSTNYVGDPRKPFPWLSWNNR